MRQVTKTVFNYSELSSEAQEKARYWFRSAGAGYEFFADSVIEEAADVADIMGIDLRQTRKNRMDGTHFYAPSVSYTGFCSQGDGASFKGRYAYKKGAMKALLKYAPKDAKLHRICKALQDAQKKVFYSGIVNINTSGYYCHSGAMHFAIDMAHNESQQTMSDFEESTGEALKDFADWIYSQLEIDYDFQNSDEIVEENIEANEYEFDEEGNIH